MGLMFVLNSEERRALRTSVRALLLGATFLLGLVSLASAQRPPQILTPETFTNLAERVSPAVVSVVVLSRYDFPFSEGSLGKDAFLHKLDEWARQHPNFVVEADAFFTPRSGSGVLISGDGLLLTSWHLLQGRGRGDRLRVKLADGRIFEGDDVEYLGSDPMTDLALLRIKGRRLPHLRWGDSRAARRGDWVMVIGNPLDFQFSISQGVISGKDRQIGSGVRIERLIQTTAMINPGSSGGAMVSLDGRLLGIVMAMATQGDAWQGVGFAIPQEIAAPVAQHLEENGHVRRGFLGIEMEPITRFAAELRGLPARDGVLVSGLLPKFPAGGNGSLQIDDILIGIDGREIRELRDVYREIGTRMAGDRVTIKVARETGEKTVAIKLAERPRDEELFSMMGEQRSDEVEEDHGRAIPWEKLDAPDAIGSGSQHQEAIDWITKPDMLGRAGLVVVPWQRAFPCLLVVKVVPGSVASQAGLDVGDLLTEASFISRTANKKKTLPLDEVGDLRSALKEAGENIILKVLRGKRQLKLVLELP